MIISSSINTYNGEKFEGALISPLVSPNRKPDITNGITYIAQFESSCHYNGLDSIKVRDKILSEYTFDMKKWKDRANNNSDIDLDDSDNYEDMLIDTDDINDRDITNINPLDVINAIRFNISSYYSRDKNLKLFSTNSTQYHMEDGEDGGIVTELDLEEEDCSVESYEGFEVMLNDLRFALYQLNTFTEASTIEMTSWSLLLYMIITESRGKHNSDNLYKSVYFSERNTNRRLPRRDSRNSKRLEFIELRDNYWDAFTRNKTPGTLNLDFSNVTSSDIFISKIIYKLFQDLNVQIVDEDLDIADYNNISKIPIDFDLLEDEKSIFKGVMELIHNDLFSLNSVNSFDKIKEVILSNLNVSSFKYSEETYDEKYAYGITDNHLEQIVKYLKIIDSDIDLYKYHNGEITRDEYIKIINERQDSELIPRDYDYDSLGKIAIAYTNSVNRVRSIKGELPLFDKYSAINGGKEAYDSGEYRVKFSTDSYGFVLSKHSTVYCSKYDSGLNTNLIIYNSRGYAIKLNYDTQAWFSICTIDNFIKIQEEEFDENNGRRPTQNSSWKLPINL